MGLFTDVSSTTSVRAPTAFQQPFMQEAFQAARDIFRGPPRQFFPGSTVRPFDPLELEGQEATLGAARNLLPSLINPAFQAAQFNLGPGRDPTTNPFFQGALQASIDPLTANFLERVLPSLRTDAISAGQFGSARDTFANMAPFTEDFNRTLNDAIVRASAAEFGAAQERGLRQQQLLPSLVAQGLVPGEAISEVGTRRRQLDQARLNEDIERFFFEQEAPRKQLEDFHKIVGEPVGFEQREDVTDPAGNLKAILGALALGGSLFPGTAGAITGGIDDFLRRVFGLNPPAQPQQQPQGSPTVPPVPPIPPSAPTPPPTGPSPAALPGAATGVTATQTAGAIPPPGFAGPPGGPSNVVLGDTGPAGPSIFGTPPPAPAPAPTQLPPLPTSPATTTPLPTTPSAPLTPLAGSALAPNLPGVAAANAGVVPASLSGGGLGTSASAAIPTGGALPAAAAVAPALAAAPSISAMNAALALGSQAAAPAAAGAGTGAAFAGPTLSKGLGAAFGTVAAPIAIGALMLSGILNRGKKGKAATANMRNFNSQVIQQPEAVIDIGGGQTAKGRAFEHNGRLYVHQGGVNDQVYFSPEDKQLYQVDWRKTGNFFPISHSISTTKVTRSGDSAGERRPVPAHVVSNAPPAGAFNLNTPDGVAAMLRKFGITDPKVSPMYQNVVRLSEQAKAQAAQAKAAQAKKDRNVSRGR